MISEHKEPYIGGMIAKPAQYCLIGIWTHKSNAEHLILTYVYRRLVAVCPHELFLGGLLKVTDPGNASVAVKDATIFIPVSSPIHRGSLTRLQEDFRYSMSKWKRKVMYECCCKPGEI